MKFPGGIVNQKKSLRERLHSNCEELRAGEDDFLCLVFCLLPEPCHHHWTFSSAILAELSGRSCRVLAVFLLEIKIAPTTNVRFMKEYRNE